MKENGFSIVIVIVIVAATFFAGYRSGSTNGYNDGFKEGVEIAEEYAKECYNDLNCDTEDYFGFDIYNADAILQEYEASGFEHISESELIKAQYALSYFSRNIWKDLTKISEASLELGEVPSE